MDIIKENKWPYVLIYPDLTCKEEYRQRFINRGNSIEFCRWHDMFFDKYYYQSEADNKAFIKIKMQPGEFVSDIITQLEDKN